MSDTQLKTEINKESENEYLYKVTPRFSAWMEDDRFIVRVVLPGVDKKDIEMKALQNRFLLRAKREKVLYDLDLSLDIDIKPNSSKAEYKEGLLRVEFTRVNPLDDAFIVPIE